MDKELRSIEENYRIPLKAVDNLLIEFVELRGALSTFVIEEQTDLKPLLNKTDTLIKTAESVFSVLHEKDNIEVMQQFVTKLKEYRFGMVAYSQELLIRRTGEGVRSWERTLQDIESKAHSLGMKLKNSLREEINQVQNIILRRGRIAKIFSMTFGVMGILVGIAVAFLLHKAMLKPIQELVHVSQTVAKGDLRQKVRHSPNGEFGTLSRSIATMVENLQHLVKRLSVASSNINKVSEHLNTYSNDVSHGTTIQNKEIENVAESVREMDAIINEINANVTKLTNSLEQSSSFTSEMTASINELSNSANNMFMSTDQISSSIVQINTNIGQTLEFLSSLSASSLQVSSSAKELTVSITDVGNRAIKSKNFADEVASMAREQGISALEHMIQLSRKNKEVVEHYSRIIKSLGKKSSSIEEILDIIQEVAEHTNLLSLNAGIIAAQAGEHGKSFAVVSDEVRKLANKTTANVKQIADVIEGVNKEIDTSVKMVSEISTGVDASIASAVQANDVLNEIESIASQSAKMASESSDSVEKQATYCNDIYESVTKNSQEIIRIEKIFEELKKGSDTIVVSGEEIRTIADTVKQSAQEQSSGSKMFAKTIDETHAFSGEIMEAMRSELEASQRIVKSLENISHVVGDNLQEVETLNNMVKELVVLADKLNNEMARFKLPDSSEISS
jgi:methyl-accepting chemotaxis protein